MPDEELFLTAIVNEMATGMTYSWHTHGVPRRFIAEELAQRSDPDSRDLDTLTLHAFTAVFDQALEHVLERSAIIKTTGRTLAASRALFKGATVMMNAPAYWFELNPPVEDADGAFHGLMLTSAEAGEDFAGLKLGMTTVFAFLLARDGRVRTSVLRAPCGVLDLAPLEGSVAAVVVADSMDEAGREGMLNLEVLQGAFGLLFKHRLVTVVDSSGTIN